LIGLFYKPKVDYGDVPIVERALTWRNRPIVERGYRPAVRARFQGRFKCGNTSRCARQRGPNRGAGLPARWPRTFLRAI